MGDWGRASLRGAGVGAREGERHSLKQKLLQVWPVGPQRPSASLFSRDRQATKRPGKNGIGTSGKVGGRWPGGLLCLHTCRGRGEFTLGEFTRLYLVTCLVKSSRKKEGSIFVDSVSDDSRSLRMPGRSGPLPLIPGGGASSL